MAWCGATAAGSKERTEHAPERPVALPDDVAGLAETIHLSTRPSSCWPATACSVLVSWLAVGQGSAALVNESHPAEIKREVALTP